MDTAPIQKTEEATCQDCSKLFPRTVLIIAGQSFGSSRCEPCIGAFTAQTEKTRAAEASADRDSIWRKVCPASYRDTNPQDTRLNSIARALAGSWDAKNSTRGIGLIGSTGLGKTRCLFVALKRAHEAGRKVAAISHTKFSRVVLDAFSGGSEERREAKAILANLIRADVLLLDDLGKAPSTERADSELENLIEERTSAGRPILWTANGHGAWLEQRLGEDRGKPTARRLAEFCHIEKLK